MDGNMVVLLVGRAELNKDTVRGAAGRERGGWVGWGLLAGERWTNHLLEMAQDRLGCAVEKV